MTRQAYGSGYLPALQGLRAVAAYGVLLTHVSFVTGLHTSVLASILERFDFFVAVFFALSAFLLWRAHVIPGRWQHYLRRRALRILPAYLAFVVACLFFLPATFGQPLPVVLAQLTLTQIWVPNALVDWMSHLYSLCVEVCFYLTLPLVGRLRPRWRGWCVLAAVVGAFV